MIGTVMGFLFLRGVGIVGHEKAKPRDATAEEGINAKGKPTSEPGKRATRDQEHDTAVEETSGRNSAIQEKDIT